MNRISMVLSFMLLSLCFGLLNSFDVNAQDNAFGKRKKSRNVSVVAPSSPELSTTIVISQVYPGGGSGAAGVTYMKDYVELKNISATPQSIVGLSLQYGSSTGNFGSVATNIYTLTGTVNLQPGQYYLVELAMPGAAGAAIVPTPDESTTNLAMSATNGKVALTNTATALGCGATATPCALPHANIIDLVAWGTSNNGEGGTTVNNGVALPANTNGGVRKTAGCTETDNNNADFDVIVNPVPRNASSTAAPCGGGGPAPTSKIFETYLNGANEVGPNGSAGLGYGRVILNAAETQITASFYWENLGSGTQAGHIHRAAVGVNGPVIFDMMPTQGLTSGSTLDRVFAVTPAQVADLRAGLNYFNIHTTNFGGGEIRGQLRVASAALDFDADGRTEYVVLRDSNGATAGGNIQWHINLNSSMNFYQQEWGIAGNLFERTVDPEIGVVPDVPVPADYDGDGKTDIAVWRNEALATFHILNSADNTIRVDQLGISVDNPKVVGDYNGDGKADPAVYRIDANGGASNWYYRLSPSSNYASVTHGTAIDVPAPGDYDGDGRGDFGVFSLGQFRIVLSGGGTSTINFGLLGEFVVPGDYDGDGKTDPAVVRQDGAFWRWDFEPSGTAGITTVTDTWGILLDDFPVPGDYNGDGKSDYAVYRGGVQSEFLVMTPVTRQISSRPWGLAADLPAAAYGVH